MMLARLKAYQQGNAVKRYHSHTILKENTVGQHSANMALIAMELADLNANITSIPDTRWILQWCLIHDLPECLTGDIPAPVKWRSDTVKETIQTLEERWYADLDIQVPRMSQGSMLICKAADAIEAFIFCHREIQLGNQTIMPVYEAYRKFISDQFIGLVGVKEILNEYNYG